MRSITSLILLLCFAVSSVTFAGTIDNGYRNWTLSNSTDSMSCFQSTSPWVENVTQFGSSNVVTGTGASGAGIPRFTISNDSNILATQSGTWTVQQGTPPWSVGGNVADAATDSGNTVKVGGVFDTTLPTYTNGQRGHIELDANGRTITVSVPVDGSKQTYSAGIAGLTPAASATDVFTISGSATKTIRINYIQITMTTTSGSGASTNLSLIKRSALDTAGTSTTQTNVPHDSANAAGTAVVKAYTVNPTALGTAVGAVRAERYAVAASNTIELLEFTFGNRIGQAIVLRGTSENLAINFNASTPTGAIASISIEWTEE